MRGRSVPIVVLVSLLGAASCGDHAPAEVEMEAAAKRGGALCEEHGVLEAVCTKCNPKLIPVFQAKGDWCEEHGFPESFCPICHPERGGKHAAAVADDGTPPDGTKVRFKTKETARRAGIETAEATAGGTGVTTSVPAVIRFDATRRAEVNARAPGVIRELLVDVGARVELAAPLVIIESAAMGADQARLRAAGIRVRVATETLERERSLLAKGIAPRQDVLVAQQELEAARAEHTAAEAALQMVGSVTAAGSRYTLGAPLAGTVTRRTATIGQLVDAEEPLFEVVDVSAMLAEVDVPEQTIGTLVHGGKVVVTVDAIGDRAFEGTIDYIASSVDPRTRTVKARVRLPNPDGTLRDGMFGRAVLARVPQAGTVVVPRAAVQRAKGASLVFVRIADDLFEARRVQTGFAGSDTVELTRGVAPGELVATTGSFLLKTETLKGSIGAGCCDVE